MPNWKKIIVSGSDATLNSLNVVSSFTSSGLNYPTLDNGEESFMQTDGNGNLSLQYVKTIYEEIVNGESTPLVKGTPVYVSGSQGAASIVFRADPLVPSKMPVVYIVADTLAASETGKGIALGLIKGIDTTGFPAGTEIYLAPGGGWTSTRPTGSSIVQVLGYVTKEGNGGQGVVLNSGPANLPNLPSGSVWVGNLNSIPTPLLTSSLSVASASFASSGDGSFTGSFTGSFSGIFSNVVSGSGLAGQVSFWNGVSTQTGDNNLFWNNTDKRLGLGLNNPQFTLHAQQNTDISGQFVLDTYTNVDARLSVFAGRRARGTADAPLAILDNDSITALGARGYDGVSFQANSNGSVGLIAFGNWSPTSRGTKLTVNLTNIGSTTTQNVITALGNGNVGIGTTTPSSILNLSSNVSTQLFNDGYSDTTGTAPQFVLRRARGTEAAPTALLAGNLIGSIAARGHNGTEFTVSRAALQFAAAQNWTTTANGTRITLSTTENGTTTLTERVRIDQNGNVGIGTTTPTERLDVNGNVRATRFIGVSDIQRMPFKQNATVTHTGTITNTIIASYLIPAGTFDANDVLRFNGYFTQTNNANVKTARIYVNSTATLVGATQIAIRTLTSSAGLAFARELVFKNSLTSQEIISTAANSADSETATNTAVSALSLDFSVDQHIIVAVQLANAADSVSLRWLRSEILR
jgi:hypothetical protein